VIDTHCHLLPGIDDGPKTAVESVALARGLHQAGVRTVVCTPHLSRRFPTVYGSARTAFGSFAERLERAGVPLRLALAAELSSAAAVQAPANELRRRQLGNGYLLVELESGTAAGVVEVVVSHLSQLGLTPVFAHPERCRAVRAQPRVLDTARKAGALVQVVAPSLVGRSGDEAAAAAWRLLESGRVDLLASDSHRPAHAHRLERALAMVSERLGRSALAELTETNPARMIDGTAVVE
jgi:protein-tyrosine phosphatase